MKSVGRPTRTASVIDCGSDTTGMMVTLGNSASRQSARFMYIDCNLRPETMKVNLRSGRSKIAATAIDHIGANPVPLATTTMPPG